MKLAVPTFEDPPVGSRVAQVASPLDERVVRLDHLECVGAVVLDCHLALLFFVLAFPFPEITRKRDTEREKGEMRRS